MFDIAYTLEASIEAADIEYNKTWEKIMGLDLSIPWTGFFEFLYIEKLERVKKYWSIMYNTHGV